MELAEAQRLISTDWHAMWLALRQAGGDASSASKPARRRRKRRASR